MSIPDDRPVQGWHPLDLDSGVSEPDADVRASSLADSGASINGPPEFHRAPREYVAPPDGEVEVQGPPTTPTPPSTTLSGLLMTMFLPAVVMVAALVLTAYFISTAPGLLWISAPLMLVSVLTGMYSYTHERRKYRQAVARREQAYPAYLRERRQVLETLHERQRRASLIPNPSLHECRARAERRDHRLWERSPSDHDFIELRLGVGSVPTAFTIKPPSTPQIMLEPDPLLGLGQALVDDFRQVNGAAIRLPLSSVGAAGLAGPRPLVIGIVRALLMQLTTHHAPSEVKLVLTFPETEIDEWAWARWLPHTWNADRTRRFIAAEPGSARRLLADLGDMLKQRQLQLQATSDPILHTALPSYVFVFADPALLTGPEAARLAPLLQLLLAHGRSLGAYSLFLTDRAEAVRKECGAIVDLTGGRRRLHMIGPPRSEAVFEPDVADAATAEQFARTLAPLRFHDRVTGGELPSVVPLLELFGVSRVEDLPVAELWRSSQPFDSLAAPIGRRAGGDSQGLDMHQN